jgi:hypothetical protein
VRLYDENGAESWSDAYDSGNDNGLLSDNGMVVAMDLESNVIAGGMAVSDSGMEFLARVAKYSSDGTGPGGSSGTWARRSTTRPTYATQSRSIPKSTSSSAEASSLTMMTLPIRTSGSASARPHKARGLLPSLLQ